MALGGETALRELYEALGGRVRALALRVLGSAAESDDVLQETFVEVWRDAASYDASRGSLPAWVCTIARRRAVDRLRRRGTRPLASAAPEPVIAVHHDDIEQRQARERIQRALAELSPEQREAIELMYFGGLSQSEVAERLGVALGTVKGRVRAAMQRLSGLLEAFAPEARS